MKRLAGRVYIKRRRLFIVKRTVSSELRASSLKRHIGLNQIDDICRAENIFNGFLGDLSHVSEFGRPEDTVQKQANATAKPKNTPEPAYPGDCAFRGDVYRPGSPH